MWAGYNLGPILQLGSAIGSFKELSFVRESDKLWRWQAVVEKRYPLNLRPLFGSRLREKCLVRHKF